MISGQPQEIKRIRVRTGATARDLFGDLLDNASATGSQGDPGRIKQYRFHLRNNIFSIANNQQYQSYRTGFRQH
jgi:hypothetical protein